MEKITFESQVDFIKEQIKKRESKWRLQNPPWEDVEMILLERIWQKFDTYDQTQPLENWVNTVITNFTKNLLRDNLTKFSRPCILGCAENLGGNACGYTKSGIQCAECKLYATWQKKKESQFNIKASLPLENHFQEVNNKQSDFINIDSAKKVIDEKIKNKLNRRERKIYKMLYIKYMTAQEASEALKSQKSKIYKNESYAKILEFQKKIIKLSKQIIIDEDLTE
jgi:RNA polymerase sigma factor (sigma-70 family)